MSEALNGKITTHAISKGKERRTRSGLQTSEFWGSFTALTAA